jgi:hypothetical protein
MRGEGDPGIFSQTGFECIFTILRWPYIGNSLGPLPSHSLSLVFAGDDS